MRKRNNSINVRLNDTELERLNKKVETSGLSREAFTSTLTTASRIFTEMSGTVIHLTNINTLPLRR